MPRFLTPLFALIFTFLLMGKFYYFTHGWHSHLQPLAPTYLIVLKDLIYFLFLLVFTPLLICKFPNESAEISKKILLFILIFSIISLLHLIHINPEKWFQYYIRNSLLYLTMVLVSFHLIDENKFDLFFNIIVSVCFINAVLVGVSFAFFQERLFDNRAIGLCDNPNTLAGLFTFGFIILITNYFYKNKISHLLGAFLLAIATIGTVSLSYILFQALYFITITVFHAKKATFQLIVLSAVLIFSYYIINLMIPDLTAGIFSRIGSISMNPLESNTVLARIHNYDSLMEILFSKSIFIFLFGDLNTSRFLTFDSSILVLIINFGAVGFLALTVPMVKTLTSFYLVNLSCKEQKRKKEILLASIVVFILSSGVHNVFNRPPLNTIFFVEFGMILQMIIKNRKKNEDIFA